MVSKYFGQDIYGMVLGLMFGAVLSGSALLSLLGREQSTATARAVAAIG